MKTLPLALIALLSLTAGGSGYYLRGLHEERLLTLPTSLPELDQYIDEQSFCEVANAKALVHALSTRYLTEVRIRRYLDKLQSSSTTPVSSVAREEHLSSTIDELNKGVQTFEGTGQELAVAADLLRALKSARAYDRWLDVYLQALYEHPTHEVVGDFASDAVSIGQAAGRLKEVVRGFRHLALIPFDFRTGQRIQMLLTSAGTQDQSSQKIVAASSPSVN